MNEHRPSKPQCAPGDHVYQWDQTKPGFTPCVFCGYTIKPFPKLPLHLEELARAVHLRNNPDEYPD